MSTYPYGKRIVFGVAAVLLATWLYVSPPTSLLGKLSWRAEGSRPEHSVVLVVVDTLRADHLSLYGYSRDTTPLLRRRAREGRVFDHAFSTSSWTLPSVSTVLTGALPSRHGAGLRAASADEGQRADRNSEARWLGLDPQLPTVAERLRRRGFDTGAIVTNSFLHPRFGVARGFDTYDHGPSSHANTRDARFAVDRALAWLGTRDDGPFFLLVHLMDPHFPYAAPEPFRGRFASADGVTLKVPLQPDDIVEIQEHLDDLTAADRSYLRDSYDEEILFVDEQVDRLLAAVGADPELSDRTVVLLTADHGEEFFEHSGLEHGHTMYNELLHVPLVAWGPGLVTGREAIPASLLDLAPTILEMAGLRPSSELGGISLWPLLERGEPTDAGGVRRRRSTRQRLIARDLVAEVTLRESQKKALLRWPYKAILDMETAAVSLFDIVQDPAEHDDIARRSPDLAAEMARDLLRRVAAAAAERSGDTEVTLDDKTLDDLRALGYIR